MMLQAARYGDLEDVRAGLAQGIFVDCQDGQGRTGKETNKQTLRSENFTQQEPSKMLSRT
jgi:hypothetical protein